ncbi:LOW QUALITY PROTEIN: small integral membrane protein 27 [Caretta caretta]|uniref:LOW QUALITY PROTEIN: small integral membrane protein 27 n=1 Tax=Caretta caretta TaxID=8467 RepID=UPI002094B4B2|nr:LOW QUALITY PROTEIN: small integral membrane protein 27 [Caretta caretta]
MAARSARPSRSVSMVISPCRAPRTRRSARTMAALGRSARDWLYSLILLTIVLLSWGYVIYATRIAARWQLEKDYPDQMLNF